jgi:hypothetical protein
MGEERDLGFNAKGIAFGFSLSLGIRLESW